MLCGLEERRYEGDVLDCKNCKKIKNRDEEERKLLINRLKRIEGQVRGLIKMVEEDAYCTDILDQTSAARSALGSFGAKLLETHIGTCVKEGLKRGEEGLIEELSETVKKMLKS
jgi:DNA-binding FrmR family transcriptional regulator